MTPTRTIRVSRERVRERGLLQIDLFPVKSEKRRAAVGWRRQKVKRKRKNGCNVVAVCPDDTGTQEGEEEMQSIGDSWRDGCNFLSSSSSSLLLSTFSFKY